MLAVMLLMLAPSGWGGGGCPNGQCGGPSYQIPFFAPQAPPADVTLAEGVIENIENHGVYTRITVGGRAFDVQSSAIDTSRIVGGPTPAKMHVKLTPYRVEITEEPVPEKPKETPKAAKDAGKGQGCPDCEHCECGCENGRECKCKQPGAAWPDPITRNEGLILDKMPRHSEHVYWIHDGNKLKPVNRQQAFASLKGDGALPDDSKALRLSCIGTAEECATIEKDVTSNPAFSDLKGAFTFQSYRPDNAMVADIGVAPGKPAVYLQAPDGKVLQRWESYAGPEATASALRKKRPDYDPKKDPNGNEAGLFDLFNIKLKFPKFTIGNNPLMLLACVVAAAFVWKKL